MQKKKNLPPFHHFYQVGHDPEVGRLTRQYHLYFFLRCHRHVIALLKYKLKYREKSVEHFSFHKRSFNQLCQLLKCRNKYMFLSLKTYHLEHLKNSELDCKNLHTKPVTYIHVLLLNDQPKHFNHWKNKLLNIKF